MGTNRGFLAEHLICKLRVSFASTSQPSLYLVPYNLLVALQSSCFSDSLRIVFPCDYIVTQAYVWAAYHIHQFISYLSKSCLLLVS